MKRSQFDVAVVGELNPDLIVSGNVMPEFGQIEKLVSEAKLTIGSSSAIFACGAARLGLKVAFIGKVGNDLFGQFMRQALEEYGIETRGIIVDTDTPTGISIILTTGNDRAILTYPGTISKLSVSEIDQTIIRKSRHLHIGSYYIQEDIQPGLPDLFDQAHRWRLSISLDPNYDPSHKWDSGLVKLLEKVDVFLPNALECQGIAGKEDFHAALTWLKKKVKYLAVKLGENGALLCHGSNQYRCAPIRDEVTDTVGAGDSFDAGFVYGYLARWEPERMLNLANICGALSTRQAGGTAGQPTVQEAISYL